MANVLHVDVNGQPGRPFHIMYHRSRTNPKCGVSNCGRMLPVTQFREGHDIVQIVGICRVCKKGPVKRVQEIFKDVRQPS